MPTRYEVCSTDDLAPGEKTIVEVSGLSIGVFNIDGEYHALNNVCPHQLAPLCEGAVTGTVTAERVDPDSFKWEKDGYIITCPWHNWEFDIKTGESVFNPHKVKTRTYDVEVETTEEVQPDQQEPDECSDCAQKTKYGASLRGEEPPVETYDVEVEDEVVVLYV